MDGNPTLEEFGKNLPSFRFAVLHHQLPIGVDRGSHWDLLLEPPSETAEGMLTFEVPVPPSEWEKPTLVRKLADHRPFYLDYEGPISGNRGDVTRILEGKLQWLEKAPEMLLLRLQPAKISSDNNLVLSRSVLQIRKNPGNPNQNEWEMVMSS